jgi:hypothetical protein
MVAAVLTANVGPAVADEPATAPTPTPVAAPPAPDSTPATDPAESPTPPEDGQINYVTTVTTTTTNVNAPIIVVAAPITTTNNTTAAGGTGALERFALSMTGCGRAGSQSAVAQRDRVRYAHVRLAQNATLMVRVNGRRVATLRLPPTADRRPRGVALRLRLAPDGMLTIHRPSGQVLAVQGCTPA